MFGTSLHRYLSVCCSRFVSIQLFVPASFISLQKKEDSPREKGEKTRFRPKSSALKRRVWSHLARCHEKVNTVVARSTCLTQNVQTTSSSDERFQKLRCRKSARCGGARHNSKSKCTEHTMLGALLEVVKCTQLWRETNFEMRSVKN